MIGEIFTEIISMFGSWVVWFYTLPVIPPAITVGVLFLSMIILGFIISLLAPLLVNAVSTDTSKGVKKYEK